MQDSYYQDIVNLIVGTTRPVKVMVSSTRRGKADYGRRTITMPMWPRNYGIEYDTSYIIHEACHFLDTERGHGPKFKAAETKWLREFGLVPIHSRAYVKALTNLSGIVVWARTWRKRDCYVVGDIVPVE